MRCCRPGPIWRAPLLCAAVRGAWRARRPRARHRERRVEHPVRDEAPGQCGQHARGRQLHAGRAEVRPLGRHLRRRRSGTCRSCSSPRTSRSFDRVVYVFESELYRIKPLQEAVAARPVPAAAPADPRHGRHVQSARSSSTATTSTIATRPSGRSGSSTIDALADRIVQTTLAPPADPRASAADVLRLQPGARRSIRPRRRRSTTTSCMSAITGGGGRRYRGELLPAFEQIRDQVGEIGFIGLWWDAPPAEGPGGRARSRPSSPIPRRSGGCGSRRRTAVMYHDVIQTMSSARINIFTQRPVLRHLKHLTLKYFEIFCADTIPLLMLDARSRGGGVRAGRPRAGADRAGRREAARCAAPPRSLPRRRRGRPPPSRRALLLRPARRGTDRGACGN